ncbi:MAG: hypothetical protein RL748_4522, partial [Pseudomonadota bacterium]
MTGILPSDSAGFLLPERELQWDQARRSLLRIERDVHRIAERMRLVTASQTVEPQRARRSSRYPGTSQSQSAPARQPRQAAPPSLPNQAAPARRLNPSTRAALQAAARPAQATTSAAQAAAQRPRRVSARVQVADAQTTPPPRRGRDGRYIAGNGSNEGHSPDVDEAQSSAILSRLAQVLGRAGANLGDMNQIDPALDAANELKGMASSVFNGIQTVGALGSAVLGRPKPSRDPVVRGSIPWYQRIIQQLKL